MTRVVAVLVSYNRRELLEKAIQGIVQSEQLPDALVVVDNKSTDGSTEYLRGLRSFTLPFDYEVVTLPENTGGAGGFTVGIAHALAHHNPDLVWIMDDDTEPQPGTVKEAVTLWESYPVQEKPVFIGSTVLWSDGRPHPMNTPRTLLGASATKIAQAKARGARPVRSASFVSLFLNAAVVRDRGLPLADYFLWNDDFEFTARLARGQLGLVSDRSQVKHHTKVFAADTQDVGERFYYEVRNKLWLFRASPALAGKEKLLYLAASLRRWLRMVARAKRKPMVLKVGLRGLRDGLLKTPRNNAEVLDGIYHFPEWKLPLREEIPQFSVLMPVYAGDNPKYLRRAIASVGVDQERKAAEIVLVQDGPVPEELATVIAELEAESSKKTDAPELRVLRLPKHQGLAYALDAGLEACRYDVVARMDADDVSHQSRFAKQLPYLEAGYDIVGTAIEEIADDESTPLAYREVPWDSAEIAANTGFRSPFHHPSVVYRKSAVQAVGGYGDALRMEDFWLWMRLLRQGYRGVNLPQQLLRYRVNAGAYNRRGGWKMLQAELGVQNRFLRAGYITPGQWARNVVVRCGYRLVPTAIRQAGYRKIFTQKSD